MKKLVFTAILDAGHWIFEAELDFVYPYLAPSIEYHLLLGNARSLRPPVVILEESFWLSAPACVLAHLIMTARLRHSKQQIFVVKPSMNAGLPY